MAFASILVDTAAAQGWRLRLDSRVQAAAYRGVEADSIAADQVVVGPTGGFVTPDGFNVRCPSGSDQCYFFRAGARRRGGPLVTSAHVTGWGFGITGLSVRMQSRYSVDLGDADAWPSTEPAWQLIEAYADYTRPGLTARLGRQTLHIRLGTQGFDGGKATVRLSKLPLEGDIYLGLGLARGVAIPVTSPALNPLDEFRPERRQLLAGGAVAWRGPRLDARLDYQREVDRETDHFISERIALSADARIDARWTVSGGAEYDLSNSWFGTSDLSVRYATATGGGTVRARHYRPHFDLWTIWGAFSPVPYRAIRLSGWWAPLPRLRLRASAERFGYSDTETATPLVEVDDGGSRFGVGATVTPSARWTIDAGFRGEYGPGALADGFEGSITFRPGPALGVTAYGAFMERPLEFRFGETSIDVVGFETTWRAHPRLRVSAGAARYMEDRDRPDASSIDWTQTRLHAGITLLLRSDADRMTLPPAVRRRPAGGRE